jgi:succinoglycan biosynthesis transport protein ExoP
MTSDSVLVEQRTLSDYLAILRRRVWVIVPTIVLVGILAYARSSAQDKVFRADAEILLSRQTISSIVTGVQSQDALSDPVRFAQTQAELARSPEVAQQTIAKAGVRGRTQTSLLLNSHVTPSVNADLLRFTVDDSDPGIAARLAQAYAEAFTAYRISLNTKQLADAYKELQVRIGQLRAAGQTTSALYRQLVGNAQQLRTLELLQTPDVVVKPATHASQIAPRPLRAGLLGAGIGVLLGLALGFLWEALDKRVRTEGEIEDTLGLPILARVPPHAPGMRGGLWIIHDSESPRADAVRRLRTNLEFANLDRKARMIMITSAIQEEGKSTTAADLAVAFAQAGRDVTLVDLDLRKPTLAELFRLRPTMGLTDVVIGRTPLEKAIVSVPLPAAGSIAESRGGSVGSLRVLPAGTLPASPGQFIGTEALAHLLERLREEHSLVLVDTPPLLAVGDAGSLSAHMDGIVVIARLERITRGILTRLAHELQSSGASKLGVVITGMKIRPTYEYGYQARGLHLPGRAGVGMQGLPDRPSPRTSSATTESPRPLDRSNGSQGEEAPPQPVQAEQAQSMGRVRRRTP